MSDSDFASPSATATQKALSDLREFLYGNGGLGERLQLSEHIAPSIQPTVNRLRTVLQTLDQKIAALATALPPESFHPDLGTPPCPAATWAEHFLNWAKGFRPKFEACIEELAMRWDPIQEARRRAVFFSGHLGMIRALAKVGPRSPSEVWNKTSGPTCLKELDAAWGDLRKAQEEAKRLTRIEGIEKRTVPARTNSLTAPSSAEGRIRKIHKEKLVVHLESREVWITAMADLSHRFRNDEALLLTLDPEAYQEWKAFERSLEPRIGKKGDLLSIRSWASKLPGAVARIAAICHVASHVGQQPSGQRISSPTIASAIEMGRRLIPHALAAHRLMLGGSRTVVGDVVAHYTAEGWPRKPQGQSEWWRQVRRYVGDSSADFEPVARVLVDHGYLIEIEPPESPRGGRPPRYYRANRRLLELPVKKPPDIPN